MHSIRLGTFLKDKMDALHIECTIRGPQVPSYDSEQMNFIKTHLLWSRDDPESWSKDESESDANGDLAFN